MLNVIKSNVLLNLVLLLSLPNFASQPESLVSKLAQGTKSAFARCFQAMPSWQTVKSTGNTTYAIAKQSIPSVIQYPKAFASQHSTAIKCTSGILAILGLQYVANNIIRKIKGIKTELQWNLWDIALPGVLEVLNKLPGDKVVTVTIHE